MNDEKLPRAARIRTSREIRRLLRTGTRCRVGPMDAFVRPATRVEPRVGWIVPLHGRTAVERNRLRRRLREIARRDWLPIARARARPVDILIRARREAYDPSFKELRAIVLETAERPCDA